MTQTSLEQTCQATSAGTLAEPRRNWALRQTLPGAKAAYAVSRILTQVSILAMAAMSTSPVLGSQVAQLGPGPGTYWLQVPTLLLLGCLTLASFALTSRLRGYSQGV